MTYHFQSDIELNGIAHKSTKIILKLLVLLDTSIKLFPHLPDLYGLM